MGEFSVTLSGAMQINFDATGIEEILQNVAMIMNSVVYSCPMDRNFAWDGNIVDRPINVAKTLIASRLIAAVNKYEPRAEITKVTFKGSDGKLQPTARVRILNG